MKKLIVMTISLAAILSACKTTKKADLIIKGATIYTVDSGFSVVSAMAVKDGKVLATGSDEFISTNYSSDSIVDASGKFIYPGFIDAHAHFYGYGRALQEVNLIGTKSWEEVLEEVVDFAKEHPSSNGWIIGNGWDQNDWETKTFPDKQKLDELFPDRPVYLTRIDGHAAIANQVALAAAGINAGQRLQGGLIGAEEGKLTGILVDNAMDLLESAIPEPDFSQVKSALLAAQKNCFAAGLTTVVDCGLGYRMVEAIDSLQKADELKMRLYVMLSDADANYAYLFEKGAVKTPRLNVRAFKLYADGALGSRGACLLHPYHDQPDETGFMLSDREHFEKRALQIYEHGFQMCTHAIGDSANREILEVYAKVLKGPNDKRWRIEHAQIVHPDDVGMFGKYDIVPSVQPTHATSDMYWADERLGPERIKTAYIFKDLLEQNGWIPLGTDFPVENVNPMYTFYAAVFRQDGKNYPEGGFQIENSLSRQNTLRGMTIWAAKSCFEEDEKGSLEPGKYADFVIMDIDLMKADKKVIYQAKPIATYVGGERVFGGF